MAIRNSFPNDLATGQSLLDTRMTNAGLVARDENGIPRTGLIYDSDARVVSPTASMAYLVRDFRAVTSRSGNGVEFIANDGAVTLPTPLAPSANSRIDIIYVRARFLANADGSAIPHLAVASGGADLNPQPPTLPPGALELARFTIPAGVTATNQSGSGVIGQDTCRFTAAAGGTVVVRDAADLASWKPGNGSRAYCLSDNGDYVRSGGAWRRRSLEIFPVTQASMGSAGWDVQTSTYQSEIAVVGGVATISAFVRRNGGGIDAMLKVPLELRPSMNAFIGAGAPSSNGGAYQLWVKADGNIGIPSGYYTGPLGSTGAYFPISGSWRIG